MVRFRSKLPFAGDVATSAKALLVDEHYCSISSPTTFLARYLTHPQVKIDPAVPSWELSALGRDRTEILAN
jgi:hypothetical protein